MKHYIAKVWIESGHIYAQTRDGFVASYAISLWKRLASATEQQLNDFYLSYSGIHWPQLDEDLNVSFCRSLRQDIHRRFRLLRQLAYEWTVIAS